MRELLYLLMGMYLYMLLYLYVKHRVRSCTLLHARER